MSGRSLRQSVVSHSEGGSSAGVACWGAHPNLARSPGENVGESGEGGGGEFALLVEIPGVRGAGVGCRMKGPAVGPSL
eukprot:2461595-Heterocapsa_arctica.AAC.1